MRDESASQHSIYIMTLWCIRGMGGIKHPDGMPQGSNYVHFGLFISFSNSPFRRMDKYKIKYFKHFSYILPLVAYF